MFEKFTDRARKVMALANQEAQRFDHMYIGTEHLLLGLLKEGSGPSAKLLKEYGVDLRNMRREVEKLVPAGPEGPTMGRLPQTPKAKKVVEYAIEESSNLGHNYVGTEHLLLGLLREHDGVHNQVLANLGLKREGIREHLLDLVRKMRERATLGDAPPPDQVDAPALVLLLDPGTATAEEIAELLLEFSTLYRMLGGSGITFTTTDARDPAIA